MYRGFVTLHRKLKDWQWYKKDNMVHLFIHLLISANYEKGTWQGVTIERGQLATGRNSLHEATGISEQSIRTCLNRLKSTNEITIQSTNNFSIITICNFDTYQLDKNKLTNKSTNELTPDQPTTNQQLTTNNKSNKAKKTKKDIIYPILDDVIQFFKDNGYSEFGARKCFQYYVEGNWTDRNGDKVINWKQKMRNNWFKDEYRAKKQIEWVYYYGPDGCQIWNTRDYFIQSQKTYSSLGITFLGTKPPY